MIDFANMVSLLYSLNTILLLLAMIPAALFMLLVWRAGGKKSEENCTLQKSSFSFWLIDLYVVLYVGLSIYGQTRSWLWSIFAAIIIASIFFNAFLIRQVFGSITVVIKEMGKKQAVLWVLFGYFLLARFIVRAIDRDDEEEGKVEW